MAASTAGRSGRRSVTTSEPQLPDRLRAAAAGRLLRAVPARLSPSSAATSRPRRRPPSPPSTVAVRRRSSPPSAVASILIEPVLGEGGYIPAPAAFLQGLRELCDEHGILLIADEVQSGYGRTGKMWAFEHAGIVPDVVCVAKAIANGLPLSAIVSSPRAPGALGPRRARLDLRRQPGRVRGGHRRPRDDPRRATWSRTRSRAARSCVPGSGKIAAEDDRIGDIRGPGLMIGVEFVTRPGDARAGRRPAGPAHGGLRRRGAAAC